MLKSKLFTLFCLLVVFQTNAQSYMLEGISSVSSKSIKSIMNGKDLAGYILFYKRDKADKKNTNYGFDLLDEKLNKVSSVKFVLPSGVVLLECTYNGEALGLMFYDTKKSNYILKSFDKKLQAIGTTFLEKPNRAEFTGMRFDSEIAFSLYGLQSVPEKGFVRPGYGESNSQFKLSFYGNDLKEKWKYETPASNKGFENFLISDINSQYITGVTIRRNSILSKKMSYFLTVFKVDTGEKILDVSTESDKQQLSLASIVLKENSTELLVQGEFYAEDDRPGVDKSKGIYLKTYDLISAKEVNEHFYSWAKDLVKLFDAKGKASLDNKFLNYPHAFFKMANGNYYMVFEQYKKVVDGASLILSIASQGAPSDVSKVQLGNIWVLELDSAFKPLKVNYYVKDQSTVFLPYNIDFLAAGYVGFLTKWLGEFDYQFFQKNKEETIFNISYVNYDREKGEKTKTIVGNIFLNPEGNLSFDKIDITAPKHTSFFLYPAQSGYVMLAQYMRKEEKLECKLVKLNY